MDDLRSRAKQFLPLTEASFYILASLGTPAHGYRVIQAVEKMSGGKVVLGPGTLYGSFQRMLKQGLIQKLQEADPYDERRKLYRLTPLGVAVISLEVERLREMASYGEICLKSSGGEHIGSDE